MREPGDTVLLSPGLRVVRPVQGLRGRGGTSSGSWWGRYDQEHLGPDQGQGRADRPEPLRPLRHVSAIGRWFWEIDKVLLLLVTVLIAIGLIAVAAASPAAGAALFGRQRPLLRALLFLAPARLDRGRHAGDDRHFDDAAGARAAPLACSARPSSSCCWSSSRSSGPSITARARWIEFGVGQVQPSEFLKPFFVVAMAWLLSLKRSGQVAAGLPDVGGAHRRRSPVLLMKQPDFGSTIIFVRGLAGDARACRASTGILVGLGVAGLVGVILAYFFYASRRTRIDGFLFGDGRQFPGRECDADADRRRPVRAWGRAAARASSACPSRTPTTSSRSSARSSA